MAFAATTGLLFGGAALGLPEPRGGTGWLSLFSVGSAAAVVGLFALHGATFVAIRTTGEPRQRALRLAGYLVPAAFVLLLVLLVVSAPAGADTSLFAWLFGAAGLAAIAFGAGALHNGRDGCAFAGTTAAVMSLPLAAGSAVAAEFLGGAADVATLTRLSTLVLPVLPVALAAQVWLWWIFRHRVDAHSVVFF